MVRAKSVVSFPWAKLLVLSCALLLFCGVLGEIAFRVGELRTSDFADLACAGTTGILRGQHGLFRLDDQSGFAMRPNLCVRLRSPEYDHVLRTNTRGFVGPDVPSVKAPGEFRIVILGDSYTAGGQVPYDQNYTALLQDLLVADGFSDIRVINAGVGGCGTDCQAVVSAQRTARGRCSAALGFQPAIAQTGWQLAGRHPTLRATVSGRGISRFTCGGRPRSGPRPL
jgi:hypothetical protein